MGTSQISSTLNTVKNCLGSLLWPYVPRLLTYTLYTTSAQTSTGFLLKSSYQLTRQRNGNCLATEGAHTKVAAVFHAQISV